MKITTSARAIRELGHFHLRPRDHLLPNPYIWIWPIGLYRKKENLPVNNTRRMNIPLPDISCRAPPGRGLALRVVGNLLPATLSGALIRPSLVYPLASLDVSGQWPVSHADASPNEVFQFHCKHTPTLRNPSRINSYFFITVFQIKFSLWKLSHAQTK
jgi:hypothetical protein